jgi:HD-like signal output (HDOD) protein
MYQVVAVSLNPALLSFIRKYCENTNSQWQLRVFPTIGSYVAAPRSTDAIDLLFLDAETVNSSPEQKRLVCFMAPLALRVVVTKTAHEDVVLDHLDHFHSFIGHSIDDEHLSQLFESAARLPKLPLPILSKRLLSSFMHYPVFPSVCNELRQVLKDPAMNMAKVAAVLERDPVIVSRLLQLVNSPYMGFASETLSLETAISRLGLQLVQTVALMLSLKSSHQGLHAKEHQALLTQSLQAASKARQLAMDSQLSRTAQDHVFTAVLFRSMGQLLLLQNGWPVVPTEQDSSQLEIAPDVAIAVYLLTLWGFPANLLAPMLTQHQWLHETSPAALVSNCLFLAGLTVTQWELLPDEHKLAIAHSPFASAMLMVNEF